MSSGFLKGLQPDDQDFVGFQETFDEMPGASRTFWTSRRLVPARA